MVCVHTCMSVSFPNQSKLIKTVLQDKGPGCLNAGGRRGV
jgi:hypothetical protein